MTVATFGDSLDFPAFFTQNSGFKVQFNKLGLTLVE